MNRRELIQSITAAVAADYDAAEYSVDGDWGWDGTGGLYQMKSFAPAAICGGIHGTLVDADLNPADATDSQALVQYNRDSVQLDVTLSDGPTEVELLADLTDEQARELAIGLWQAVDQRQRRNE